MLENGLVQACNQWNEKKLSPTLGIASFNSDLDEEEQFLEVRYHSSAPETPVMEVLEHMHNSSLNIGASGDTDYTTWDISYEDAGKHIANASEPPESPSIPRDPIPFDKANKEKHQDLRLSKKEKLENKLLASEDGYTSHSHRPKSTSSNDSDKLTVHALLKPNRLSGDSSDVHFTGDMNHSCDKSQLQPANKIVTESRESANLLSVKLQGVDGKGKAVESSDMDKNGGLTLYTTTCRPETDELIEDLDSPESISKIDKEDCFSWEQDHLLLSIDHEQDLEGAGMTDSARSLSTSASHDSVAVSDRESVSSDSTTSSLTQQERSKKYPTSLGNMKSEYELSSPASNQKKSKAIKNKLSAAFNKVGGKSKVKDEKEEAVPKLKGEVLLQEDQFGYPLAIFTKASHHANTNTLVPCYHVDIRHVVKRFHFCHVNKQPVSKEAEQYFGIHIFCMFAFYQHICYEAPAYLISFYYIFKKFLWISFLLLHAGFTFELYAPY